jgi:hypothetical protein
MVVQDGGALKKSLRLPGLGKPELLKIQVVAKLVAEDRSNCTAAEQFFNIDGHRRFAASLETSGLLIPARSRHPPWQTSPIPEK